MRRTYLDYNATAPLRPEVRSRLAEVFGSEDFQPALWNASSVHWAGQAARKVLEQARQDVARQLNRLAHEVIFTSGGTESDNLALTAVLSHPKVDTPRLVLTAVEHPAVWETAMALKKRGVNVEVIAVSKDGELDLEALNHALETPTTLVSAMHINNETGVVFPIEDIATICKTKGVLLHVDAVQSVGRLPLPVQADLISLAGHKFGALKGSGVLGIRKDIPMNSMILGGPQERDHRAGTENILAQLSLAHALEVSETKREHETQAQSRWKQIIRTTLAELDGVHEIGLHARQVSATTAVLFENIEGDALVQALDLEGIAVSAGSACASGSLEPSRVMKAMGYAGGETLATLRISTGHLTTDQDIRHFCEILPEALRRVRTA